MAPTYNADKLCIHTSSRPLRSTTLLLLTVPQSQLKQKGDRAFAVSALRLWNSLLLGIRHVIL